MSYGSPSNIGGNQVKPALRVASVGLNSIAGPPEHESGVLTNQPRPPLICWLAVAQGKKIKIRL
jgi:hypothetical protein